MLHHYAQKGMRLDYLMNLPLAEKLFLRASLEVYKEEETAKWSSA